MGLADEDLAVLAALIEAWVLVALIYVWIHTGGLVINWLNEHVAGISVLGVHPLGFLQGPLTSFNNSVQNDFYFWLQAAMAAWNQWCFQIATFVSDVTHSANFWMSETEAALHFLARWKVPAIVSAALNPISFLVHELERAGRAVTHEVTHVVKPYVQDITHDITKTVTRVEKVTETVYKTTTKSVAIDLPKVWHGIDTAENDATKAIEGVKANLKKLTVTGIAGLVGAAVFSAFDLGWLRCSNVGRVGKFLCGFDRALLDALIAGLALFLGTLSLEAFAKDVQAVTLDFEGEVRKFWRGNVSGPGGDRALGQTGL